MSRTRTPHWIDTRALMLLHVESLAEHGGLSGLRDNSLLESAMARPRNLHAYEDETDLAQLAAAYGFGIVRNHPFNDGNKRAGFLAIGLFLAINGRQLSADPVEAIAVIWRLAEGKLSEEEWAGWIRANMTK
jgi:death on curing protein